MLRRNMPSAECQISGSKGRYLVFTLPFFQIPMMTTQHLSTRMIGKKPKNARNCESWANQKVCEVWFDAPSGEDEAGGIWALCRGTREGAGDEARHLRLPRIYAHLRTQPKREVHRARADDAQKDPSKPEGARPMVPRAPSRPGGGAAQDPQCQAPGPLPVLRATD